MKAIPIKKDDINVHVKDFRYYIIYYFDRLDFGEGDIKDGPDIENINEAFLFDEDKCMHIYREDGVKGILYIYDEDEIEVITELQTAKKGKGFEALKGLVVKKVINIKDDEDGQAYIERVLPAKLLFR